MLTINGRPVIIVCSKRWFPLALRPPIVETRYRSEFRLLVATIQYRHDKLINASSNATRVARAASPYRGKEPSRPVNQNAYIFGFNEIQAFRKHLQK